jgi:hypothetical protein
MCTPSWSTNERFNQLLFLLTHCRATSEKQPAICLHFSGESERAICTRERPDRIDSLERAYRQTFTPACESLKRRTVDKS